MINTILLGNHPQQLQLLKKKIEKCCPCLNFKGIAASVSEMKTLLVDKSSNLVFVSQEVSSKILINNYEGQDIEVEKILVTEPSVSILTAIQSQAVGYVFRPIKESDLIAVVEKARICIKQKQEIKKNKLLLERLLKDKNVNELIGIPTIEGYEFIHINDIIRCEGLQKCTHIITKSKTDIISSYNIGQFKKLLESYGFFSPHKSHLINLSFIKKYRREGTILFHDGSYVPVAKRRKSEFLKQIVHI